MRLIKKHIILLIICLIIGIYELLFCNHLFLTGESTYAFSLYRIVMYIIVVFLFMKFSKYILGDREQKIGKMEKYVLYITILLLLVTLISVLFGKIQLMTVTIIVISLLLVLLLAFSLTGDYLKNFILIALAVGFIFSMIMPINNQLDEKRHFLSAYNLSYANINFNKPIINEGVQSIPQKLNFEKFNVYFHKKYEPTFLEEYELEDISSIPAAYNPIQYLPSATGIYMARLLGGSIADIYYAGRFFNLIGYIGLVVLTLKILPYKKKSFYVIFLMPMLLALASVYSVDGIIVGVISLWIAYCLKLYEQKEKITGKQLFILLGVFTLIGTLKSMSYLPIALFVFIIPIRKLVKENKKYLAPIILLGIFSVIINIGITLYLQSDQLSDPRVENTNAMEQIEYIKEEPSNYIKILGKHIKTTLTEFSALSYLNGPMFFGNDFDNIFLILLLFLFYTGITDDSKNLNKKVKWIAIITFFVVLSITSTLLYISYTPLQDDEIKGYQLRYIFPIISLIVICLSSEKIKNQKSEKKDCLFTTCFMVCFLAFSIYGLLF